MSDKRTFMVSVPYATYSMFTMEADSLEDAQRIVKETPAGDLVGMLEYYTVGHDGEDDFAGIDPEMIEEV